MYDIYEVVVGYRQQPNMSYNIYNGVLNPSLENNLHYNVYSFYVNSLVISAIMVYEKGLTVWLTGIVCNVFCTLKCK